MKYILDHAGEFERLKRQNLDPEFDPLYDLQQFSFGMPSSILDAGCGSGAMIPVLNQAFPFASITGVDGSEARIAALSEQHAGKANLHFIASNLTKLPFCDAQFDVILFRYVLQHLDPVSAKEAFSEAHRCLKPGGKLLLIDVDGYLETMYPIGPLTRKMLDLVAENRIVDLHVARKLPTWIGQGGFCKIQWKIETVSFQSEAKNREIKRTLERLDASKSAFLSIGMTGEQLDDLKREVLQTLSLPESVCFLNRFYISGQKPTLYILP